MKILLHRYSRLGAAHINFLSWVTSTKYKICLKPILVKIQSFSNAFQNYNFYLEKVVMKKKLQKDLNNNSPHLGYRLNSK